MPDNTQENTSLTKKMQGDDGQAMSVASTDCEEARDLERVTFAVFRAAAERHARAKAKFRALQCHGSFTFELTEGDCTVFDCNECVAVGLEVCCELPADHNGDHGEVVSGPEATAHAVAFDVARATYQATFDSMYDASAAWVDAMSALAASDCGHPSHEAEEMPSDGEITVAITAGHAEDNDRG
ncbi:hypothetical protein [Microbacterium sp. NPDC055665]